MRDRQTLKRQLMEDKRSKEEIFAELCTQLRPYMTTADNPSPSEDDLKNAARNLIGFCEALVTGSK